MINLQYKCYYLFLKVYKQSSIVLCSFVEGTFILKCFGNELGSLWWSCDSLAVFLDAGSYGYVAYFFLGIYFFLNNIFFSLLLCEYFFICLFIMWNWSNESFCLFSDILSFCDKLLKKILWVMQFRFYFCFSTVKLVIVDWE